MTISFSTGVAVTAACSDGFAMMEIAKIPWLKFCSYCLDGKVVKSQDMNWELRTYIPRQFDSRLNITLAYYGIRVIFCRWGIYRCIQGLKVAL